jgi:isocitrate dehydrogenase
MATGKSKIIYTLTDEAPLLATCAFLPIIRTFTGPAGIEIEKADISVSARVLAEFSEYLSDDQKVPNTLGELGKKTLEPDVNIIKLPNISASVAQLKACVKELQAKGYPIPDYPESPIHRRRKGHQVPLRQVPGLCGQPGAARRQLRPPRAAGRQELRPQEPALHG